ncbi:MAG: hypothetical protein WA941_11065 [Nitrososphaeraceae archaeon]
MAKTKARLDHLIYGSTLYVPPLSGQMMMIFSFVFSTEADNVDAELDSLSLFRSLMLRVKKKSSRCSFMVED